MLNVGGCTTLAPPSGLRSWHTGNTRDAITTPTGGLVLIGGGRGPDKAHAWFNERTDGGDVVILRTSRSDGYNDYLCTNIGGIDSVLTMLVTTRALAEHPWVIRQLDLAEGIFIAGGDQATYIEHWANTPLAAAIDRAHNRGAVIGGTSAGAMVLGEVLFDAANGTISSADAQANPQDDRVSLHASFVHVPQLKGVLIDTHFTQRNRLGRLHTFLTRALADDLATQVTGLGIDEATAVLIAVDGTTAVIGKGHAHRVEASALPDAVQQLPAASIWP